MSNTNLNCHGFKPGQIVNVFPTPASDLGEMIGWTLSFTNEDGVCVYHSTNGRNVFVPWTSVSRVSAREVGPAYRADADYQSDWPGMAEYEAEVAAKREARA